MFASAPPVLSGEQSPSLGPGGGFVAPYFVSLIRQPLAKEMDEECVTRGLGFRIARLLGWVE